MILRLDGDVPSSASLAQEFEEKRVRPRLQALDSKARRHGVSGLDPQLNELIRIGMEIAPGGRVTKNGYGLFRLSWIVSRHPEWAGQVLDELDALKAGIKARHGVALKFVVWAGMGGSAEDKAMYQACGLLRRGPKLYLLDSADPAKLKAILADLKKRAGSLAEALKATLVAGMATSAESFEPVLNLQKLTALYEELELDPGPNFFYIAPPDSLLERFAATRGYRRVELQLDGACPVAARHSAPFSRGSLYPLGLAGVPLGGWLAGAVLSKTEITTAFRLAAFLHRQGLSGRDKVTLALSRSLAGAAEWTKQDFEQSLGKSEQLGIRIVTGEPIRLADYRAPKDPRQDRVFLLLERPGEPALSALKCGLLRRSGYPVARLTLPAAAPLSHYLQFVHTVVFALAWLRETNFVTQPGVDAYRAAASALYQNSAFQGGMADVPEWKHFHESPRQIRWRSGVVLNYSHLPCGFRLEDRSAPEAYAALLAQLAAAGLVQYADLTFFGDTRYGAPGKKLRRVLGAAAARLFRGALKLPVDVEEAPAANHSGYEMAFGHGRCLSTLLISEKADSIPGVNYTADFHRAGFLATQIVLERQARLAVSITLRDLSDATLKALDEFFRLAATHAKKLR